MSHDRAPRYYGGSSAGPAHHGSAEATPHVFDERVGTVLHYAAFTRDPAGGNRAGVVLDAGEWSAADMQRVAAEVGYSETAFVVGETADGLKVRYFSPVSEVPFCGHATIALGVALAEQRGPSDRMLLTRSGTVPVQTSRANDDSLQATLTSVTPQVTQPEPRDLEEAMDLLGWTVADLHPDLRPRVSFAGASHLVLVAARPERLNHLAYDYEPLKRLLDRTGWITIHLAWPHPSRGQHTVRNAFPAGPVREDPATGAAAAAYGAYLRELGFVQPPVRLELRQGEAMGRPSLLLVDISEGNAGLRVSGHAVRVPAT